MPADGHMGGDGLEEIDLAIGRRLRERREFLGLSHEELALACGMSIGQIDLFEAGTGGLLAAQLCILAEALETPLSYFYDPRRPGR